MHRGGGYSLLNRAKKPTNTLFPTTFLLSTLIIVIVGCETKKDDSPIVPVTQTFTLTFDTQGGTEISQRAIKNGEKTQKPTNPTKDGHIFENWYKEKGLKNIFDFTKETITTNVTVYAKWRMNSFMITFNTDGGNTIASVEVKKGDKLVKPLVPTKKDYVFVNWYKDVTKTEVFNFDTEIITKATTIYAKWDVVPHFTSKILWRGIRAVELQVSTDQSVAVAFIVRAANEAIPSYADVETNIALQSRSVTSGTHYFYTAMHYGSNQNLPNNITAAVAEDYLTAGTAYKAYVFQDNKLVSTLDFSTLVLPAATDWDETKDFIDGTFPYREGIYQIDIQEGTVLLLPFYWKQFIDQAISVIRPDVIFIGTCLPSTIGNTCVPNTGYALEKGFEYKAVVASTYLRFSVGIQQVTTTDFVAPNPANNGVWIFKEGGDGRSHIVKINVH